MRYYVIIIIIAFLMSKHTNDKLEMNSGQIDQVVTSVDSFSKMMEEHKKLLSKYELGAFFNAPQQRIINKTHSLLSLSPSCDRINYGPPINFIVEPPSSGTQIVFTLLVGEDSESDMRAPGGPSINDVITTIFDSMIFSTAVFFLSYIWYRKITAICRQLTRPRSCSRILTPQLLQWISKFSSRRLNRRMGEVNLIDLLKLRVLRCLKRKECEWRS